MQGADGSTLLRVSLADIRELPTTSIVTSLRCPRRSPSEHAAGGASRAPAATGAGSWRGTRLAEILEFVALGESDGVLLEAADAAGADVEQALDVTRLRLPLELVLDGNALLAWELDGEALPASRGGPVRALVPGEEGADSLKWLAVIRLLRTQAGHGSAAPTPRPAPG